MTSEPIWWLHLRDRSAGPNLGTDLIDVAGAKKSRTCVLLAGEDTAYLASYSLARNDETELQLVCESSEPAPHLQHCDDLGCSSWPARARASEMSVPGADASASKPVRAQLDRLTAQPQEA
ncbi:hypothetical protein CN933_25080 [Sinorhizobium sp. M4_45]|nr:hypothetical protein CN933_25080 [Sinorhizobium sp. M4_45]